MSDRWTKAVLAVALSGCSDGTSPAERVDGVWAARVAAAPPGDSLTLALGVEGTQVRGFAILRSSNFPDRVGSMFGVQGTLIDGRVDATLSGSGFGPVRVQLSLALEMPQPWALRGTVEIPDSRAVTFRRVDPEGHGVDGTWLLISTTGPPNIAPALRDTIVALADGRGRRHREDQSSGYATLTTWQRRGDWLFLDQYQPFSTFFPARDSVRVQGDQLVRTTALFGGGSLVETYGRVP